MVHCIYQGVTGYNLKNKMSLSLKNILLSAKCVDPDEMPFYEAFHLGIHSLPNYSFKSQQYTKG